jgi:hypothetical protein
MTKTTTTIAMIGGLMLGGASFARAQTPAAQADRTGFVNISIGSQFQTRTLTTNNTVNVFDEDGVVTANQTVGSGLVFDASGGYRVWRKIMAAVGVSTFSGKGNAAAVAAIPDRLVRGKFSTVTLTASDLKQSDVALNFQAVWFVPLADRIDLAIAFGPSIIFVKQDIASVSVNTTSGIATSVVDRQSKTTAKAGTASADFTYRLTDRYGVGAFVRYLGGKVDLPAAPSMTVGGVQAAVGLRVRF